jgi:hypothetical protein
MTATTTRAGAASAPAPAAMPGPAGHPLLGTAGALRGDPSEPVRIACRPR